MEGINNNSTATIRNKRGDWLAPNKTGIWFKILAALTATALVSVAVIITVPFIKKYKNSSPKALASTHHNTIKNETYNQLSMDEMLKSYGYAGLEKDALQLCDLKPESRGELGRGTWTLLHIMASTYPPNPSPEVIQDHRIFFQLLPRIYPCPDCRAHMRKLFHEFPPQLNSRTEFAQWLCNVHNIVNRRLGKPIFDCSKLDERWDCGCNIVPGQAANNPMTEMGNHNGDASSRKQRESRSTKKDSHHHGSRKSRSSRVDK